MQAIKYDFNPYTYARICAMRGLLLKKNDYDKLMKMEPNEILKFLQEGTYSNEINELSFKYKGLKLIEMALNRNLTKLFLKFRQISDKELHQLIDLYLQRYDYYNIKTILRAKIAKIKFQEIEDILLPVGFLKFTFFKKIFNKEIKQILIDSKIIPLNEIKKELENFENSQDLTEIENALDYYYYKNVIQKAEKLPKQGILFKEFFQYEIAIYNLKIILKKIFFGLDKKIIENYLLDGGKNITFTHIKLLLNQDNYEKFLKEFNKTYYGKIFKADDLIDYELLFENFLLKKRILLLHQHPLSVDSILGFMFEKEIEVKNLKIIIKSKKLSLDENKVSKLLIIEK